MAGALEQQDTTGAANVNLRFFGALAKAMTGQLEEGRAEMQAVKAELDELGMTLLAAQMQALGMVELELLAGEPEAAILVGTEGCRRLEELGERSWLSTGAGYLAQALCAVERFDEAEAWAERAKELGASDDAATQMLWRQAVAKALARRGELAEAELRTREAVLIGEQTDHLDLKAHARLDLGVVLEIAGKPGEARAAFEQSLELFERKGNTVMAGRVREIIAAGVA